MNKEAPKQSTPETPGIVMNQNGVISSRFEGKAGKKFHNGWTPELEELATEWADHASCYQWMHERSRHRQSNNNLRMKIPMIILSTLSGTASFGLGSFFGDNPESKNSAQYVIGSISILVGVIGTLDTFFQYAQSCEMHNTAAVNWGNFQRNMEFQLKLHPNERIEAMPFMKMMQNEMNRLIEQSPSILSCVLKEFQTTFKEKTDLKKPSLVNGLDHTIPHVLEKGARQVELLQESLDTLDRRIQQVAELKATEIVQLHITAQDSFSTNQKSTTPPTIVIREV
jgi:hypothetical protein